MEQQATLIDLSQLEQTQGQVYGLKKETYNPATLGGTPDPGQPPLLGDTSDYYIEAHEDLVESFAAPESRTKRRLRAVLAATADALQDVLNVGVQFFDDTPAWKLDPGAETRWNNEVLATLERFNAVYAPELVPKGVELGDLNTWGDLDPESTDTAKSYEGLILRRSIKNPDGHGAGPVPDSIMHLYFLDQLGILEDHVEELGDQWAAELLLSLPDYVKAGAEKVDDTIGDAEQKTKGILEDVGLAFKIGAGLVGGAILVTAVGITWSMLNRPARS